jgi:preprotein translocase subunit SecD
MTITFKYNGKQYTTNNLEKKLNKLGISENDIELLGNKFKVVEIEESNKQRVIVRSTEDNIRRVCFIDKDKSSPTMKELFKNHLWNPLTKTGIREITEEYLMTLYYEN